MNRRTAAPNRRTWRTVDIVVASVVAGASGVVFWAWNLLWNGPADAIPLPGRAFMYGVWLVPAVLGAMIVRRPGAAFYTETVAALVSVALGTEWGWTIAVQGPIEALAGELGFALLLYRVYKLPVALLSGALAGLAASIYDIVVWYPTYSGGFKTAYVIISAASALVVAGGGGWALTRSLAQTGVLDRFPSGRERAAV